ncbi:hypothetical protein ISCGN_032959 [Ixodes scapularis]
MMTQNSGQLPPSMNDGENLSSFSTPACRLAAGHYFISTIVQFRWPSFFTRVERLKVVFFSSIFRANIILAKERNAKKRGQTDAQGCCHNVTMCHHLRRQVHTLPSAS